MMRSVDIDGIRISSSSIFIRARRDRMREAYERGMEKRVEM